MDKENMSHLQTSFPGTSDVVSRHLCCQTHDKE